ncbi:MAG TPA: asparagine synthase (glutamine-hydrolyzing) [Thermoleophilaceae bacterium]|nr:asparagine synthase (glutamine-hydrolyzing) [Thermoleophilaceae bacterium]
MCGIGAILDPAGTSGQHAAERMVEALRHRGPDGEALRRIGPVALAHTRLAIIDVAGGDQPLDSEDGRVTAIVNGEIYNHRALREQLEGQGHRWATNSDSEVVVHAYEQHGVDFVRRLNGIFAFVIWDERERRLVAARDAFGVKPLYWWTDGRRVALASEIGALIDAGLVTPAVDRVALDHYLACRFVPSPRTLFEGVRKLPPASTLVVESGGAPRVRTWREDPGDPIAAGDDDLAARLAESFGDAVERQMMSDVPYGAFLSGGVDSAGVVAAMKQRSGTPPTTFTIGFPGHGDVLDERALAAESARIIGTDHRDTVMRETDFLTELGRCVPRLEEPCGIPSAPALLQLSRFAAQDVKVVLAGQGADEPHGGYGRHRAAAVLGQLRALPNFLAKPVAAATGALPRTARAKRAARLLGDMPDASRLVRLAEITDHSQRAALSGSRGEEADEERAALAQDLAGDVGDRGLLEQALYLDTHLFLPDGLLVYGDKMSMAHGLEQRVPFLDVELMRFVERIPAHLRLRRLQRKWLYKRSLPGLVPESALRRRKAPFATPYDDWLRSALGAEVERAWAPGSEPGGLLDGRVVGRLDEKRLDALVAEAQR